MATTKRIHAKGILTAAATQTLLWSPKDQGPWEPTTLGVIVTYVTTGTPATLSAQIESSPDGTNWTIVGSAVTNTSTGTFTYLPSTNAAAIPLYLRANLTVLTGGTAPTVAFTVTTQNGN